MGMISSEMFNTSFLVSGKVLEVYGSAIYVFVFPLFFLFYIIGNLCVFFIEKALDLRRRLIDNRGKKSTTPLYQRHQESNSA